MSEQRAAAPELQSFHEEAKMRGDFAGGEGHSLSPALGSTEVPGVSGATIEQTGEYTECTHGISLAEQCARCDRLNAATPVQECFICGKPKGQPPDRCPGHYEPLPVQECGYRKALAALVARLDEVHADPLYQSVWQLFMLHGGDYTNGPTYGGELKAAAAMLSAPCGCAAELESERAKRKEWQKSAGEGLALLNQCSEEISKLTTRAEAAEQSLAAVRERSVADAKLSMQAIEALRSQLTAAQEDRERMVNALAAIKTNSEDFLARNTADNALSVDAARSQKGGPSDA